MTSSNHSLRKQNTGVGKTGSSSMVLWHLLFSSLPVILLAVFQIGDSFTNLDVGNRGHAQRRDKIEAVELSKYNKRDSLIWEAAICPTSMLPGMRGLFAF